MKFIFCVLTFTTGFCLSANADSFNLIKDGKNYLCTQTDTPVPPPPPPDNGAAIACGNKAYAGPFNREESIRLCAGAYDVGPADCGIRAYAGPFSKGEAVQLCTGTRKFTGPADCGIKAYAGPFNKDESVRLCAVTGTVQAAECAISAYAGPYNKEEAVQLCRQNSVLMLKALKLLEQSEDAQLKIRALKK